MKIMIILSKTLTNCNEDFSDENYGIYNCMAIALWQVLVGAYLNLDLSEQKSMHVSMATE